MTQKLRDEQRQKMLAAVVRAGRWSAMLSLAQQHGDLERIVYVKEKYLQALRMLQVIDPVEYAQFIGSYPDPLQSEYGINKFEPVAREGVWRNDD